MTASQSSSRRTGPRKPVPGHDHSGHYLIQTCPCCGSWPVRSTWLRTCPECGEQYCRTNYPEEAARCRPCDGLPIIPPRFDDDEPRTSSPADTSTPAAPARLQEEARHDGHSGTD